MIAAQNDPYPDPPEGYRSAVLLRYPTIKLQIVALVVLMFVAPLLFLLVWVLHHQPEESAFVGLDGLTDFFLVLITVLTTTVIHEFVHGLAYRWLGYRVSLGVSRHLFAAYAAAFEQWQRRDHNIMVALAPLVLLTALFLPLICVSSPAAVLIGLAALLMNIGGSVGDVYLVWRLLRLPQGTLLYDINAQTMLIFKPVERTRPV